MNKLTGLGVISWMRYVDDVFAVINDSSVTQTILLFLNAQNQNIKFTIETEKQNRIPLLDTRVTRKDLGFTTTIYHRPTFTGVYLNWTSLTSRKYKISLIYCLSDRIWRICREPNERDLELKKLKQTLIKKEYPEHIINKEIEKFIKNRTDKEQQQEQQFAEQQQATVEKQK
jgi:hypothetical protein